MGAGSVFMRKINGALAALTNVQSLSNSFMAIGLGAVRVNATVRGSEPWSGMSRRVRLGRWHLT